MGGQEEGAGWTRSVEGCMKPRVPVLTHNAAAGAKLAMPDARYDVNITRFASKLRRWF